MSDVTVLPTGGTSGGGGPNWLLIGGLGAGAIILLLLLTKSSSGGAGQPTTAAGTSINAALGSIQEQNLNLMGQLGQAQQSIGAQVADVGGQVAAGNTAAQQQNATWYGNLTQLLTDSFGGLNTQVAGVGSQVAGVGAQVGEVQQALPGISNEITTNDAALSNELANLQAGTTVWDQTLAQKADYLAAIENTYLPGIYARG